MIKRLLLIVVCSLCAHEGTTQAQQISMAEAREQASTFLRQKQDLRNATSLQTLFTVTDTTQLDADASRSLRASSTDEALLYAFGDPQGGFVITTGDRRASTIVGYSTTGTLDRNNLPEGLRKLLRQYAVEIAHLDTPTVATSEKLRSGSSSTTYDPSWSKIAPLITSEWNQSTPYNNQMPLQLGKRCLTGYPATMFGQLMDYYRYQNWKVDRETWRSGDLDQSAYLNQSITVQFKDTVNWSLLKRNYETEAYTPEEANEIAKLMNYAGAAMHNNYGATASGINAWDVLLHLDRVAGYGKYASYVQAWQYSLYDWHEMIYEQLAAKRPLPYASMGGGHIFLLDGYDGEGYFHFNWGWGNYGIGYYLLTALRNEEEMHLYQVGIFDCCPSTMEPIHQEPLLLSDAVLQKKGVSYTMQVVFASLNPALQQGKFCYAIHDLNGKQQVLSDPISYSFTPKAYESDTITFSIPQLSRFNDKVYLLSFWQVIDQQLQQMKPFSMIEYDTYLVKEDNSYWVGWLPAAVDLSFAEPPSVLYKRMSNAVTLNVTSYLTGMQPVRFTPILFNAQDTFKLDAITQLISEEQEQISLAIRVPDEADLQASYQLYIENNTVMESDTVTVTLGQGPELVLTQVPEIPNTLYVGENNVFVFQVKNIGTKDFKGQLHMGVKEQDGTTSYIRAQDATIAIQEEILYTGGIQSSATLSADLFVAQDQTWPLALQTGEPFERPVQFVLRSSAVETVEMPETTLSRQGSTFLIQCAVPLDHYQVYDIQGRRITEGSVNGPELRIDGAAWSTGTYLILLRSTDRKTWVTKVVR